MNQKFKRVLALLLTLCMVVPMLPVSSFAVAVGDTKFTQGDPDAVPETVEKAVWVQTEWEYICGYTYEHTHVSPVAENDCFDNSNCSHNHTDDCYNKELVLCMHEADGTYDGEHIDSKPGSELTNGEKAGCADYQSAYQTAYEAAKSDPEYQQVYDDTVAQAVAEMKASEEYKKAYNVAYLAAFNTPNILDKNPAYKDEAKSRAAAEEACAYLLQGLGKAAAERAQVSYCDTKGKAAAENGKIYCYKNTTLKCDHATGCPYPGDCWVESCGMTEHTHSDACKRWTWILKADANTNGTPDEKDPKYTVSFDLNGGTGSAESQSVLVGLKAEQVTDPTRTYYAFEGWFYTVVENEAKVEKEFDFETEIKQDYALKAKWSVKPEYDVNDNDKPDPEETQYTVVYKSGYGENEILYTHSNKVEGENTPRVAKEDEPKRAGYNFAGWTPAVADKLDTGSAVNGVITYTAQWNQLCNVFFMLDENTQYGETVSVEKNSTVPAPENAPAKDYYNFLGWYEKNADTSFDFTKEITENVHLYAKWSVKSDCDDNANGIADAEEVKYVITYTDGMENVELFPDQATEVLPGMPTPCLRNR